MADFNEYEHFLAHNKINFYQIRQEVDKDLYSRTIAALGEDVVKAIAASNVLVSGLNGRCSFQSPLPTYPTQISQTGLGCEIAKNVLLGGVKSLTLHDTKPTSLWDLSSQFFLTEQVHGITVQLNVQLSKCSSLAITQDVGKNRAAACMSKLQELNSSVLVKV